VTRVSPTQGKLSFANTVTVFYERCASRGDESVSAVQGMMTERRSDAVIALWFCSACVCEWVCICLIMCVRSHFACAFFVCSYLTCVFSFCVCVVCVCALSLSVWHRYKRNNDYCHSLCSSDLVAHVRVHALPKFHPCAHCSKNFTQSGYERSLCPCVP